MEKDVCCFWAGGSWWLEAILHAVRGVFASDLWSCWDVWCSLSSIETQQTQHVLGLKWELLSPPTITVLWKMGACKMVVSFMLESFCTALWIHGIYCFIIMFHQGAKKHGRCIRTFYRIRHWYQEVEHWIARASCIPPPTLCGTNRALNYLFWGNQTMQNYVDFEGFPL